MSAKRNKQLGDAWAQKHISRAEHFTACLFLGRGRYDKRKAPSLEEVREHKRQMLVEYAGSNFGRGVLIYAVTKGDNLSILVE